MSTIDVVVCPDFAGPTPRVFEAAQELCERLRELTGRTMAPAFERRS